MEYSEYSDFSSDFSSDVSSDSDYDSDYENTIEEQKFGLARDAFNRLNFRDLIEGDPYYINLNEVINNVEETTRIKVDKDKMFKRYKNYRYKNPLCLIIGYEVYKSAIRSSEKKMDFKKGFKYLENYNKVYDDSNVSKKDIIKYSYWWYNLLENEKDI